MQQCKEKRMFIGQPTFLQLTILLPLIVIKKKSLKNNKDYKHKIILKDFINKKARQKSIRINLIDRKIA
jgi:hypothetical protein